MHLSSFLSPLAHGNKIASARNVATTSTYIIPFQVNDIAFHPVHFCLLATVGSDGKFSFWDKDARTKLKVNFPP